MVKKSGFLNKIVGRFRGGSVKVEEERTTSRRPASPANPAATRAKPTAKASTNGGSGSANGGARRAQVPVKPVPEEIIPSSKRKLSDKEAAQLKMSKGFQELSSLLGGVSRRMEDQGSKLDTMNANVAKLPAAAEAQVEMLRGLVTQIEKSNQMNSQMFQAFSELPTVMKGVQDSLTKAAATDERTSQTLDDFKSTMDRIQGSMGEMVESTKTQQESHTETVESMKDVTSEGLEALRRAQEDQANRMTKIVGESGRANRVIVVLLVLSFGAMVAILAALLNGSA